MSAMGFNMVPLAWTWNGPAQRADGIPAHAAFSLTEVPDTALLTDVAVLADDAALVRALKD
jgi:hypothetical protein